MNKREINPSPNAMTAAGGMFFLAVIEYWVFRDAFFEFFQGDALFWMEHRFRRLGEFVQSFWTLDTANWYRPLSNRTIPAIFFEWFGLNPHGYHWVVFILFFISTCLVLAFLNRLTSDFIAAVMGTLFFSIHSNNVYVTYDFAFAPELLYASFYVLSCIAYLKGLKSGRWYLLSLVSFALALMSKEAAATLPANLAMLDLLLGDEILPPGEARTSFAYRLRSAIKRTCPFFTLLLIYYAYIVRYLGVGAGDYAIALHSDVLLRLFNALCWAFNFSGGLPDPFRMLPAIVSYALIASSVILASCALLILTKERRLILFGLTWFFIALTPMLGIVGHFGAYYLYLPMVGLSLVVAITTKWWRERFSHFVSTETATALTLLLLVPFFISARLNAQYDLAVNTALGYAGRTAERSLRDIKTSHPAIPKGATIFIENSEDPDLWRYYGIAALFRLAYADDSINVLYSSHGNTVSEDILKSDKLIAVKYASRGLTDITGAFQRNPEQFLSSRSEKDFQYITSDSFKLHVSPTSIKAGSGSYTIGISGAPNAEVELQYRLNGGPLAFITVKLNPNGEVKFFVSTETQRGTYRFVGFKLSGQSAWIRCNAQIAVTD